MPTLQNLPASLSSLRNCAHAVNVISDEWRYTFISEEDFRNRDVVDCARIYWEEMIHRAEIVALTSLFKAVHWIEAITLSGDNYYSFASALRGMIESLADSLYTLRYAPLTLAKDHYVIAQQLASKSHFLTIHKPLEDLLLHFIQATKLSRTQKQSLPEAFSAKSVRHYLEALDFDLEHILQLYAVLCGIVHPAHESTQIFLFKQGDDAIVCSNSNPFEAQLIDSLLHAFSDCVDHMGAALQNSVMSTLWVTGTFSENRSSSLHSLAEQSLSQQVLIENTRYIETSKAQYDRACELGRYEPG
jgi:hypothetical protein